jgi:WhiB family redox-sensing transcriptional regulator
MWSRIGSVTIESRIPILPDDRPAFWHQAACAHFSDELFFPAGDTGDAIPIIEEAKSICWGCPVADECLEYAIESNQTYGIWGGTTEQERVRLRRRLLAERRTRRAG